MYRKIYTGLALSALLLSGVSAHAADLSADGSASAATVASNTFDSQDLNEYQEYSIYVINTAASTDIPVAEIYTGVHDLTTELGPYEGTWFFYLGGAWAPENTGQSDCSQSYAMCVAGGYVLATATL